MITKSERINLLATPRQLAAFRLRAEVDGISLSRWMRRCAEREVRRATRATTREPSPQAPSEADPATPLPDVRGGSAQA